MTQPISTYLLKQTIALVAALAVAFTLAPPRPAAADPSDLGKVIVGGIVAGGLYCAATGNCTVRRGGGGGAGPVDAIGLSGQNAMLVQGGLQNLGFYNGAIDGAIGAGTRASIRAYQAAIGANQTGVLTGQQINDLAALSPSYFSFPADSPQLFAADLAHDLDREGVRQLQAALNQQGYAAGAVDGAFGAQTRNAIAAYKASNGLPGQPLASRRMLARLRGWAPPEPLGKQIVYARQGIAPVQGTALPAAQAVPPVSPVQPAAPQQQAAATPTPIPLPATTGVATVLNAAVPAGEASYDILGVKLGMSEAQVKGTLMAGLGGELMFDNADGTQIGGGAGVSRGFLTVQPNWPEAPAEQVMALFDDARPELGAVAVFRMIRMPEGVDEAVFEAQVLPDIVANYGTGDKRPGEAVWIGSAAARNAGDVAGCGAPRLSVDTGVANALDAMWRSGGGPRLDGGLDAITTDCGQVLSVDYAGSVIRIGLWDSAAFAGSATDTAAAAPKIKF